MTTRRTVDDVLAEAVPLDGADVLDVGCGAGELVRWLRDRGARPVGLECGEEMRARAIGADPGHADSYVDGVAQDLPFDDGSFDAVVFSASLHHVPIDAMPAALAEARRVLRPGGIVVVHEPAIEPPEDDVLHPVVDERAERTAAQAAIDDAARHKLATVRRFELDREVVVPDVDEWLDVVADIEPERAVLLAEHRDHVRANFERRAERRPDGWHLVRRSLVAVLTAR
jgi:ubiquinone/menaquinone biosynthesis C-methylase UbiE